MKLRIFLALAVLVPGAGSLSAQTVVVPEKKLAPAEQAVNDAIYRLRDSLLLVEAAGSRIARDRAQASDASLRSRAVLLADRCRNAMTTSDSTRAAIAKGNFPSPDHKANLPRMEKATLELKSKLDWCGTEFTRLSDTSKAAELRGYGIGRAAQVSTAIQAYTSEIIVYLNAGLGIRYKPSVRGAGATAGGNSNLR